MTSPPTPRAYFGRIEIPSTDPERAGEFYRRVFGWEIEVQPWSGGVYVTLGTSLGEGSGGRCGAGVADGASVGADHPLAVIHLEGVSLETVLERVREEGGSVDLAPVAVDAEGTFARFRDPDGNLLGLWAGG